VQVFPLADPDAVDRQGGVEPAAKAAMRPFSGKWISLADGHSLWGVVS
jgi:hypothetical protein